MHMYEILRVIVPGVGTFNPVNLERLTVDVGRLNTPCHSRVSAVTRMTVVTRFDTSVAPACTT